MGLTVLAYANMPMTYWDHAFTTSIYLINRLPSVDLEEFTSPYHALYQKLPDFSQLYAFGCACFPSLRPTTSISSNTGPLSVCSLDPPLNTKDTDTFPQKTASTYQRMFFLISSNFHIPLCAVLLLHIHLFQ